MDGLGWDSLGLHGNQVDRDRAAVRKVPRHIKYPGDALLRQSRPDAREQITCQLPLPQPRSMHVFGSPGVSSARIWASGGGYLPMTSMNMMCWWSEGGGSA